MGKNSNITVTVSEGAYGTWLEPYIAWEFKLIRQTKNKVLFQMDCGAAGTQQKSADRKCFEKF